MPVSEETIAAVASSLDGADHVAALTGAGVSTASGVPSFRGENGIWGTAFDPADFQYGRLRSDPGGFWTDRLALHEHMHGDDVEPNPAHAALAELEAAGSLDALVTQNTDGLHTAAGSEAVVELHGTARRVVCDRCGEQTAAGPVRDRARDGEIPPRCACGGVYKPDVVLFGERLPRGRLERAREHAREADVFLAVGSSLQVEPAASLPRTAADSGATLVVVNFERTPVSERAEYDLRADVTDVLPRVAGAP